MSFLMVVPLSSFAQCWVRYDNQTDERLISAPDLGLSDSEEKNYAWGDVDQDGDTDLVVARKQPHTTPGRRTNVLFMNEGKAEGHSLNGVLVDRTGTYATQSDIDGDMGFLTPTNDRDVALADVTGDGWLDIITSPAVNDGEPKHIGHPRIYRNLGLKDGAWQGFRFEDARFPTLMTSGGLEVNPRFIEVAVADVDNDGDLDLYFNDHDGSGAGGVSMPPMLDLNDRLLINDSTGYFTDESATYLTAQMLNSAYGRGTVIADFNGDGVLDIAKATALQVPSYTSIAYNNPESPGEFFEFDTSLGGFDFLFPDSLAAGDLNNDLLPDLVVPTCFSDHYLLNQGPKTLSTASQFEQLTMSFSPIGFDDGFAGNSLISDLNNDGFADVIIADVDHDISGCHRRLHIYRNLGDVPNVTLTEFAETPTTAGWKGAPGLSVSDIQGTHDVAVFDIDNDGWKDLIVGRCFSTTVYMGAPYAEPASADCDCDGDVDLVDFARFQICFNGPGVGIGTECDCHDLDQDGDVDLTDFGAFQIAYTGAGS